MASTSSTGQMIGRFRITKALGRGAQGAVFLAHDPDLDRPVAIKLVSEIPALQAGEKSVSQQARNLAQLRHPNIIAIYESGHFHNFTFLVFEYLEGVPLREELTTRGALPPADTYSTLSQVIDAIAYAHAKGIVHLDLNPNNIMRDAFGKPRVMDFDLSRKVERDNEVKLIAGTVPYMAPEQFLTHTADQRTDVFALGRILYECLTGKRAMPNGTRQEAVHFICHGHADLEPLKAVDPTGAFTEVIVRATQRDPQHRYQDARAMYDALRQAWERAQASPQVKDVVVHGTIAFVMKRIERKGDFPAISRTLAEVNTLTAESNPASVTQLTNVVLRDYALTSRLLKLANSSFYSRGSCNVKSVSDAIKLLGLAQVRLACNSLACFGHFSKKDDGGRIREEAIASFIAGLLARHLVVHLKAGEAEEAFLAAMLHNLGRMLALYYFTDDFEDIDALMQGGADESSAARTVLGITLPEIGFAVGQTWGLPDRALISMTDTDHRTNPRSFASVVNFANRLTELDATSTRGPAELLANAQSLVQPLGLELQSTVELLRAAVQKFESFAPALEVDARNSSCVRRLNAWLDQMTTALQESELQVPTQDTQAVATH